MAERGFPWKRITVAEIEGQRHRGVGVDELLALALIFSVPASTLLSVGSCDRLVLGGRDDGFFLTAIEVSTVLELGQLHVSNDGADVVRRLRDAETERSAAVERRRVADNEVAVLDRRLAQIRTAARFAGLVR